MFLKHVAFDSNIFGGCILECEVKYKHVSVFISDVVFIDDLRCGCVDSQSV